MAQHRAHSDADAEADAESDADPAMFPWHLPIFDAHCHPTDTMPDLAAALPSMRAAALAIMATRSEDQELVAAAGSPSSLFSRRLASLRGPGIVAAQGHSQDAQSTLLLPAFGWHPWFAHQLYDDAAPTPTFAQPPDHNAHPVAALAQAKHAHYRAVLMPAPADGDALVASLPVPVPLSSFIAISRARLRAHAHALVGEVGLDKAFRLPRPWDEAAPRDPSRTPGGREHRVLSPYRVRLSHQQAVLRACLLLAAAERRPVSLHGVQAHGLLYSNVSATWRGHERHVPSRREKHLVAPEAQVDKSDDDDDGGGRYPPRICLHSFSGSVEVLQQWMRPTVPATIFVSVSAAVNLASDTARSKLAHVVRAVPDDRILVESDLDVAGPCMDAALELMYRTVCQIKGWTLDDGVRRIGRNFGHFVLGPSYEADQPPTSNFPIRCD